MKTSDGSFHYCFNGQAVVDERSQVVLAASLRQSGADCPALPDMLTELAGSLAAAGIDPLLATGRLGHGEKPPAGPRGRIPAGLIPKQRMARKLRTKNGKAEIEWSFHLACHNFRKLAGSGWTARPQTC